jgi:hypothetical protein
MWRRDVSVNDNYFVGYQSVKIVLIYGFLVHFYHKKVAPKWD